HGLSLSLWIVPDEREAVSPAAPGLPCDQNRIDDHGLASVELPLDAPPNTPLHMASGARIGNTYLGIGDTYLVRAPPRPTGAALAELLGRSVQRDAVDALLSRAREGHSGTLVVRGEAGIGKTALLEYARAAADESAFRIESSSG